MTTSKQCNSCGTPLKDGTLFCTECGTPVASQATPVPTTEPVAAPVADPVTTPTAESATTPIVEPVPHPVIETTNETVVQPVPAPQPKRQEEYVPGSDSKYQPISTWGYIGIMLLMLIPIVGFILLIVWACGGCRKVNKRNFARASLIMMLVSFLFAFLIFLGIKKMVTNFVDSLGLPEIFQEQEDREETNIFNNLFDNNSLTEDSNSFNTDENDWNILDGLTGNEDMGDLSQALELFQVISGSQSRDGLNELLQGIESANKEAEAQNDGWPNGLRAYPGGTETAVSTYRTEFHGTSLDEMNTYIENLKNDGFYFQDFYGFGLSEEDMLSMGAWWGTNGKLYLSISHVDGVVIIDHTTELPNYNFD